MTRDNRPPALKRALELSPLQAEDSVVYLARPLWGVGTILRVEPDGTLYCRFPDALPVYEGEFSAMELELAALAQVPA